MSQRSNSRNEIVANDPRYYRMQGQSRHIQYVRLWTGAVVFKIEHPAHTRALKISGVRPWDIKRWMPKINATLATGIFFRPPKADIAQRD